MLGNHSIIAIIFSLIDFKKRLSRRDTDERFHLSTTQDEVKNFTKICLVSLNMCLHLCCLASLALLQVWLRSRTSKSSSLGDVFVLIKHHFMRQHIE
jgi:hypothetical protein